MPNIELTPFEYEVIDTIRRARASEHNGDHDKIEIQLLKGKMEGSIQHTPAKVFIARTNVRYSAKATEVL